MSDSHGDLRRLHERIATLEGQLRELDVPVTHTPAWAWVFLGLCLGPMGAMVLGALGFSIWMFVSAPPTERTHEVAPPPPAPPPKRYIGARWYPQSDVTPLTVDVNGDGQDDLVGLAWGGSGQKPLLAVAFDGKTFEPLWQAGPFRGVWHSEITHLLLVNGRVVVTDAAGDIHVIDKATGKEERTVSYPAGVELACDAAGSDVLLVSSARWGGHGVEAFDLVSGVGVPVPKGRTCTFATETTQKSRRGVPAAIPLDEKRFKVPEDVFVTSAFETSGIVFGAGRHDLHPSDPKAPKKSEKRSDEAYGVAWDAKTGKRAWHHPLIDTTDVEHEHGRFTLVADDSVVTVYQAEAEPRKGPFRVVAWNVSTGEKQWAVTLPESAEGSWLGAVGAGSGRIFVVTNQGVHVLERSSGAVLTTLESF